MDLPIKTKPLAEREVLPQSVHTLVLYYEQSSSTICRAALSNNAEIRSTPMQSFALRLSRASLYDQAGSALRVGRAAP